MIEIDTLNLAEAIDFCFRSFKKACADPNHSDDLDGHFIEALETEIEEWTGVDPIKEDAPDAAFSEMALEVATAYMKLETDLERDYCEEEFKAILQKIYSHHVPRFMGPRLFWSKHHCREKYLKSLPVTKEILEANGFKYDEYNPDYSYYGTHIKFQDDGDVDVVDYDMEGGEFCFCTLKSVLDFEKAMQLCHDDWTLKLPEGLKYKQTEKSE